MGAILDSEAEDFGGVESKLKDVNLQSMRDVVGVKFLVILVFKTRKIEISSDLDDKVQKDMKYLDCIGIQGNAG